MKLKKKTNKKYYLDGYDDNMTMKCKNVERE